MADYKIISFILNEGQIGEKWWIIVHNTDKATVKHIGTLEMLNIGTAIGQCDMRICQMLSLQCTIVTPVQCVTSIK